MKQRDHYATFLPLLVVVVTQHVTASKNRFVKSFGPCRDDRVLCNEEVFRLIWDTLHSLHQSNNQNCSSSKISKHQKYQKCDEAANNDTDERIQIIAYHIMRKEMNLTDYDIEFAIGRLNYGV